MPEPLTILLLAASPEDRVPLALDAEFDRVEAAVRVGTLRDRFALRVSQETRADQLIPLMLEVAPTVVHFSGHATATDGLIFEDSAGQSQPLTEAFLGRLFAELPGVRFVVMNACFSSAHAAAIAEHVGCVVGMSSQVSDAAATAFSSVFYQAIAEGSSLRRAFDLAVLQVEVQAPGEAATPVRVGSESSDATELAALPSLRTDIARALYEAEYVNLARSISALLDDAGCGSVVEEVFGEFVVVGPPVTAGQELAWIQQRVLAVGAERSQQGAPAAADDPERVLAAVRSLDTQAAQLLLNRYYRNLTDAEIAESLGIDPATVGPGIAAAMQRVEAFLAAVP